MIDLSNFNIILPEFILFISGIILLVYGAFSNNKYFSNINILTFFSLFICLISILFVPDNSSIAGNTFVNSLFSKYIKIFIILLTLLAVYISLNYLNKNHLNVFEYPVLLLFSVLGMLVMVSSNDLIFLYISSELQSL